jgi:hypothetical protein
MVARPKTEQMAVYLSAAMRDALAEAAARLETEPAEYLRQAGIERMAKDGLWPPANTRATAQ